MNFIMFLPDEMSASSVSCYGNDTVRMPNFDRLAAEGTRFDQCIVQNPVCSPSRCSMMTGRYVHTSGHRSLWHLLRPHEPSLFRTLKRSGYDIVWFGKNDLYSQTYLEEICDDIDEKRRGYGTEPSRKHGGTHSYGNPFRFKDPAYYSFLSEPMPDDGGEIPLDTSIARAIDFLETRRSNDGPFMLYLPIEMPHPPYTAIERFYSMYDPSSLEGKLVRPEDVRGKPSYAELIRTYRRLDKADRELFLKINAVYLGMNSYVDFLLGELMDAIDRSGFRDTTTIIASSDHGDYAGQYGLVEKWPNAMEDCLVRVPLIIRSPGLKTGHVVREQVELFDLMPTVLELAGLQPEHAHCAESLVSQLDGHAGNPRRLAFAEGGYDAIDERCFEHIPRGNGLLDERNIYYPKVIQQKEHPESVCRTTMVRSMTHKLVVRTSGENELYDLERDPFECSNVYDEQEYLTVRTELEKEMLRWYVRTADTVPRSDDPRDFG